MDITLTDSKTFKIKTKLSSVLVSDIIKIDRPDGDQFVIDAAGEYEVSGISVIGLQVDKTIFYVVEAEGMRMAVAGKSDEKLSAENLSELGSIDIALIPTDMDAKIAVEIARQIDPWVIIPSGFNPTAFLKEMGTAAYEPVPKYSISKDKLPAELAVVILSSK
ncbi:MAG: hypothetical protein UU93_C0002G0025 [Candidatus Amesbacteria bacterium GW2011_GWA2_42_12]|uniref:Zn-dependent hydrolase of the beta-lactamase fold-like protein n=1 Tax=Candidatus Amesbacteria bacterium GW2011_GWA2_42_12 TaxID=1618356 RepID=A0A0G0Y8Q2_9BACT|nr:MAG: hypothetical protein UU93_C0002G0025 [Candidatus Amesbacteria bacterium GW2011_GWA2_42_12]